MIWSMSKLNTSHCTRVVNLTYFSVARDDRVVCVLESFDSGMRLTYIVMHNSFHIDVQILLMIYLFCFIHR